jgi:transcriptional regulator with XRE-family HTH domain
MERYMAFKDKIRELREAKKMSQQALAFATGLSMSVISQIERGVNQEPRLGTLKALAQALGVSLDELAEMSEASAPAPPPEPEPPRKRRKGGAS